MGCSSSLVSPHARKNVSYALQAMETSESIMRQLSLFPKAHGDKDVDGRTPLMWSIMENRLHMFRKLLALGANFKAEDCHGENALFYAIRCGHLDIAKELISRGCSIHGRNGSSETLLHVACESGHIDIAVYLISEGINDQAKDALDCRARRRLKTDSHRVAYDNAVSERAGAHPNPNPNPGTSSGSVTPVQRVT